MSRTYGSCLFVSMSLCLSGACQEAPARAELAAKADALPPGALMRLGSTRFSHFMPINNVVFGADGNTLLTSSEDGAIRFWHVATGKELARFGGDALRDRFDRFDSRRSRGDTYAVDAHGKVLAVERPDGAVVIVDVSSRKELRRFSAEDMKLPVADATVSSRLFQLSAHGRFLIVKVEVNVKDEKERQQRSYITLWDLESGKRVRQWRAPNLAHIEFTPDARSLVALERDVKTNKLVLVTSETMAGKEVRRVDLAKTTYHKIEFLADGKSLVAIGNDGELSFLDAATGKERLPSRIAPIFALSKDGKNLALVEKGRLRVQPLAGGNGKPSLDVVLPRVGRDFGEDGPAGIVGPYYILAFSKDGKTLALASRYQVQLWDLATGKAVDSSDSMGGPVLAVHTRGPHLVARNIDFGLTLWDLRTGKLRQRLFIDPKDAPPDSERSDFIREFHGALNWFGALQAISADGKHLAAISAEGPIQYWDLHGGKLLRLFHGSGAAICLAMSPNGKLIAAPDKIGDIGLWETATGKRSQTLTWPRRNNKSREPRGGREIMPLAVAFSPDGKTIAACSLGEGRGAPECKVLFWELASGTVRRNFTSELKGTSRPGEVQMILELVESMTVAFHHVPRTRHMAAVGLRSIRLWDLASGKDVRTFGGRGVAAQSAVFSPDGKLLAVGLETGGVRLWDVASGGIVRDVPCHDAMVTALSFGEDGKTLATSSLDGSVVLWDVEKLLSAGPAVKTQAADIERLWAALAEREGDKAEPAIKALAARPKETIALFKEHLRPVAALDPKLVKKLVADLDSERFAVRQHATKELERFGELVRSALEETLSARPGLETRQRVEVLLHKLAPPVKDGELLRQLRAVEVLEDVGTSEARQLLEILAAGAAGHRVTEEAREAAARLKERR